MELAFLAPAIPAAAFFAILLLGRRLPKGSAYLSIAAIAASLAVFFLVLIEMAGEGPAIFTIAWFTVGDSTFGWGTTVAPLSVAMLGIVSFVALLIQVYSLKYMEGDPRLGWYYAVHSLFAAAMMTLVLADNLLLLYIGWELVGLGSYLLIGFWSDRRPAAEAAKKAFVTTRIGDVGLLIGVILLFRATGTFDIATIFEQAQAGAISSTTLNWAAFLIFLGAAGKSAQVPFHVWLPDAMEGPTPVSALIHAATMVAAGVFLVARLFPLYELTPLVLTVVAGVGVTTAVMAALLALVMTDLKRVLAYSTVSHLGFMMLALGAGAPGVAILHLLAHAFAKAVLFLGAGSVAHGTGETDIRKMGGLRARMPLTYITFMIGALSLAGLPPLAGFFSKDEILLAVLDGRLNPVFLVLALVGVLASAAYTARVLYCVFFGEPGRAASQAHESPLLMIGPMLLLALGGAVAGAAVFRFGSGFGGFVGWVAGEQGHGARFEVWLTAVSVVVVAAGFAYVWWLLRKRAERLEPAIRPFARLHSALDRRLYFDEAYQWVVDRIMVRMADFIGLFDRAVVNDVGVNGPADSTRWYGKQLRYLQTGKVYNYAAGMAIGAVAAALIWWAQ